MIGPAVIVWRVLSRRRASIELRLDVLDVAVRTDAMAEQLLEVLLDVLLQRLPLFFVVPNSLAVGARSEEHTSELQSRLHLVCRLLLEKKKSESQHCYIGPLPVV